MSAQAKKRLNAAYGNLEQAKVVVEQFKNIEVGLETVHRRAEQLQALLKRADRLLQDGVIELKNIIHTSGTNWRHYSPKEKQKVHEVVLTAQLTKKIIDTPLLDEDDALTTASQQILENGLDQLKKLEALRTHINLCSYSTQRMTTAAMYLYIIPIVNQHTLNITIGQNFHSFHVIRRR